MNGTQGDHSAASFWAPWPAAARRAIKSGLPMVLVCGMLTVILHSLHVLEFTDGTVMRWVMDRVITRANRLDAPPKQQTLPGERIHVVEVAPSFRIRHFGGEPGTIAAEDIDNVGGVKPIARKEMATLLHFLAVRLHELPSAKRPRAIAIDVDLAPLSTDTQEVVDAMAGALKRLMSYANVLVVVWPRHDELQRQRRNQFMVDAGCQLDGSPMPTVGGLYFVSSRIFHDPFSYPLRYPFSHVAEETVIFPSLGNALHLALYGQRTVDAAESLQRLCRAADATIRREPKGTAALPEDLPAEAGFHGCEEGAWCIEQYWPGRRWMNWQLLETDHIRPVQLRDFTDLDACEPGDFCFTKPNDDALGAGALIVSVSGGARHDRFDAAHGVDDSVSGAYVHALQALSSRPDLRLDESKHINVLADLIAGGVFVLAWALVFGFVTALRHARWEASAKSLSITLPLGIAIGLAATALLWISPWLLPMQAWCNPVYILVGLLLHAYHEATHGDAHDHGEQGPDFTFGAFAWRGAPNPMDALLPVVVCVGAMFGGLLVLARKSLGALAVVLLCWCAGLVWQYVSKRSVGR